MKLQPVSTDLLVKLALAGIAVVAAAWIIRRAAGAAADAAGAAWDATGNALQAVNPANNDNVIYHTANRITGGSADDTIGTRIYNLFHRDELK